MADSRARVPAVDGQRARHRRWHGAEAVQVFSAGFGDALNLLR